jgi:hypothetical protein
VESIGDGPAQGFDFAGSHGQSATVPAPCPDDILATAARLRAALATRASSPDPFQTHCFFEEVYRRITGIGRERAAGWRQAIMRIAQQRGCSESMLQASLAELVQPLSEVRRFAEKAPDRRELIGFVMPGNIPGAGLHEVVTALIAGCAAIIKTAISEPIFFAEFAKTLREVDAKFGTRFGSRIAVFSWGREHADLSAALKQNCDRLVVFGDDDTIAHLETESGKWFAGFGTRMSGAILTREALEGPTALNSIVLKLARECTLFDQRGCLSPHHIFVEEAGRARIFADHLAKVWKDWARGEPLRLIGLEDAAAVRRVRENARWRRIGGQDVALWEGANLSWSVIYDRDASFRVSPGFRTVYVSPFANLPDLERRLSTMTGRIEAFALAASTDRRQPIRAILERLEVTYICAPGDMQSPPIDWPHGGGAFLRMLLDRG